MPDDETEPAVATSAQTPPLESSSESEPDHKDPYSAESAELQSGEARQTKAPPASALAVVLAAGAGSRFVGDSHKLAAKLSKRPILWWATQHAIDAGFSEVLVIEGATPVADLVPSEASIVRNDDWADGQSRSLHVAVHYATLFGYSEIVIGLGDQPFVPPEAWRRVAASESPIAVADFRGDRTPPVRLAEEVWTVLPVGGDEGARQLLRSRPELVVPISCPGSAVDIDTAAEFDQVRRHQFTRELGSWS